MEFIFNAFLIELLAQFSNRIIQREGKMISKMPVQAGFDLPSGQFLKLSY